VLERDEGWLGYAPGRYSQLVPRLRRAGFDDAVIVAAGLASVTDRGYLFDRFRDRIMFTAYDAELAPVGFIGRSRGGRLRYLNSPNTDVFSKHRALVGLGEQADRLRAGAVPVLVEGPMDAVAVNLLGAHWAAAAVCGTAITREHAAALRRHARGDALIVCLDGNVPGRSGAVRSLDVVSGVFGEVFCAELPRTHDPASLFAEDRGELDRCLRATRPLVDVAIGAELQRWAPVLDHISGQVDAVRAVAPLLARLPAAQIAGAVVQLAQVVHLGQDMVSREVVEATDVPRRRVRRDVLDPGIEEDSPGISRSP
jgi:DNA primase